VNGSDGVALKVIDLADLTAPPVEAVRGREILLLGWSATGHMIYLENSGAAIDEDDWASPYRLGDDSAWVGAPALVGLDTPGRVRRLAEAGFAGAAAPDGGRAAIALLEWLPGDVFQLTQAVVVDLATGERRPLAAGADLALDNGRAPEYVLPAAWSPDGQWVLVMAGGEGYGGETTGDATTGEPQVEDGTRFAMRLLLLSTTGDAPKVVGAALSGAETRGLQPVGFSADGRYLAYLEPTPGDRTGQNNTLRLVDLQAAAAVARPLGAGSAPGWLDPPAAIDAGAWPGVGAAAWSPSGRLLALAGAEGVRVVDPATGLMRWVQYGACGAVEWIRPLRAGS
jgi:hypothetical protein